MRTTIMSAIVILTGISAIPNGALADEQARKILRSAIDAAGGERSFKGLQGPVMWMERGTFYGMGEAVPFVAQYAAKWPAWWREEIEGAFVITVNGDQAWVTAQGGTEKLQGEPLAERLRQVRMSRAQQLFPLQDAAYQLNVIDGIEINGRPTVGILAKHPKHRDIKFYFDKQTYLLAKVETMVISPQHGPDPVLNETFCLEHKPIGGARLPSKRRILYDKKPFVDTEVVDYKLGATLDPQAFEMTE